RLARRVVLRGERLLDPGPLLPRRLRRGTRLGGGRPEHLLLALEALAQAFCPAALRAAQFLIRVRAPQLQLHGLDLCVHLAERGLRAGDPFAGGGPLRRARLPLPLRRCELAAPPLQPFGTAEQDRLRRRLPPEFDRLQQLLDERDALAGQHRDRAGLELGGALLQPPAHAVGRRRIAHDQHLEQRAERALDERGAGVSCAEELGQGAQHTVQLAACPEHGGGDGAEARGVALERLLRREPDRDAVRVVLRLDQRLARARLLEPRRLQSFGTRASLRVQRLPRRGQLRRPPRVPGGLLLQ